MTFVDAVDLSVTTSSGPPCAAIAVVKNPRGDVALSRDVDVDHLALSVASAYTYRQTPATLT